MRMGLAAVALGLALSFGCSGSSAEEEGGVPAEAKYEANKWAMQECVDRHRYEAKDCKITNERDVSVESSSNPRWNFDVTCQRKLKRDGGDTWEECRTNKTYELRMRKWVEVKD